MEPEEPTPEDGPQATEVEEPVVELEPTPLKRSDSLDDLLVAKGKVNTADDWLSVLSQESRKKAYERCRWLIKLDCRKAKKNEEVWAVMESMDMSKFYELVPNMAIEYPFDLDQFQKVFESNLLYLTG